MSEREFNRVSAVSPIPEGVRPTSTSKTKSPTSPPKRHAHLIGSLPYSSEREAMIEMLKLLPYPCILSLPDGEIGNITSAFPQGDRSAWTAIITERCCKDPKTWKVSRKITRNEVGFQLDYKTGARLKPKIGKEELAQHLNFGWHEFAKENYKIFKELKGSEQLGGSVGDIKFQCGIPTALGMTFSMLSPIDAIKYASCFTERMAVEANAIVDMMENEGDVMLQLEVPGELAMAHMLPKFAINFPLRTVVDLINKIKPKENTRFGLHLCYGDLNNKALITKPSLKPSVLFINRLLEKWPETHTLDFIHIPLAEADKPPKLIENWYEPLKDLKIPKEVRLIAGFVHEKRSYNQHLQILDTVEKLTKRKVDISCACGLGRRPRHIAEKVLETTRDLLNA